MNLPDYIRRPLESVAGQGLYRGHLVLGYVAPTCVAWCATLEADGEIMGEAAVVASEARYRSWSEEMQREARRRGEPVAVFELGDDDVPGLVPEGRLN